jgi:hypothetical protein
MPLETLGLNLPIESQNMFEELTENIPKTVK